MNSNILNMIGLGNLDPGIFVIIMAVLLLLIIILLITNIKQASQIKALKGRMDRFMRGKEAESLEDEIIELFEDNQYMKADSERNKKDIKDINNRLRHCVQKVGIVKYDALHQMGGQLSFALALLDEENNGYIMNSVHSNDGCYFYAKIVNDGKTEVELASEERKALEKAQEIQVVG
jgi:hypothetical protein